MNRKLDAYAGVIFLSLLGMCGVLLWASWIEPLREEVRSTDGEVTERVVGSGKPHASIREMLVGGDGAKRHESLTVPGWCFLVLQMVFLGAGLCLGMRRNGTDDTGARDPVRAWLVGGIVLSLVIVTLLFTSYRSFLVGVDEGVDSPALFLGFPVASAWLVYGIWLFPIVYVLIFAKSFRTWYYPDESREKFERLLENREGGA